MSAFDEFTHPSKLFVGAALPAASAHANAIMSFNGGLWYSNGTTWYQVDVHGTTVNTTAATYVATGNEEEILCGPGCSAVTLPAPSATRLNKDLAIQRLPTSNSNVAITGNIEGATVTLNLENPGSGITFFDDGTTWRVIDSNFQPSAVNDTVFSTLTVVNSAAMTSVFASNNSAGSLTDGSHVEFGVYGDILNNSGSAASITPRIQVNGTTFWQDATGATALTASGTRRTFALLGRLFRQGANAYFQGTVAIGNVAAVNTGLGDVASNNLILAAQISSNGVLAVNLSAAFTLDVSIQLSAANAAFDFRRHAAYAKTCAFRLL